MILQICSEIVVRLEDSIKMYMKESNVEYNQENVEKIKLDVVENYSREDYKGIVMFLLSECVHLFNKGNKSVFGDVVEIMLGLAKIINHK